MQLGLELGEQDGWAGRRDLLDQALVLIGCVTRADVTRWNWELLIAIIEVGKRHVDSNVAWLIDY